MNPRRRTRWHTRRVWLAAVAMLVLVLAPIPAQALGAVQKINQPGFGDWQNSYSWAMTWFDGKLYVGTARREGCVEDATYAFYGIRPYSTNPAPGVYCPQNWMNMDLRAEIWQYTPATNTWKMVYRSPVVPNPVYAGHYIAKDIAYRGMVVYQNQLYVLGVTADEIIPALRTNNPPRILRTSDGTNFTALNIPVYQISYPNSLNNWQPGPFYPIGYRSYAVYNDRLFVTATPSMTGDGALMEVTNPAGASPTFTQASPNTMQIFEINTFNNRLYIGGADPISGYFVSRTNATGSPFTFTSVMTGGAGRGAAVNSVVSMNVYNNRLYVGASGWFAGSGSSELIRVNPDDTWNLVVGDARNVTLPNGNTLTMSPISGLGDGFGNKFNVHFWRMQSYDGALFVGTNDSSWLFSNYPLANLILGRQYGFDLYYTCDGNNWLTSTVNAFGDGRYNFGDRSMAASPSGFFTASTMYIGSANHTQGTVVWKGTDAGCPNTGLVKGGKGGYGGAAAAPLTGVQADVLAGSTAVSWDTVPGAVKYHVLRSDYVSNQSVDLLRAQPAPRMYGDLTIPPIDLNSNGAPVDTWIPGSFQEIGQTTDTVFLDPSAKAGQHYAYEVLVEDSQGNLSPDSNAAVVPGQSPPVTFGSLSNVVKDRASRGELTNDAATSLLSSLGQAQSLARGGKGADARQRLDSLQSSLAGNTLQVGDPQDQLDLQALIDHLQQRVKLYERGLLSGDPGQ